MKIYEYLTILAIILSLVGTWLVAYELVIRFKGFAFEIKSITYDGQGNPEKTTEFSNWEMKRAIYMWIGLILITLGHAIQIALILAKTMNCIL